jgi:hypothetical protein
MKDVIFLLFELKEAKVSTAVLTRQREEAWPQGPIPIQGSH